MQVIRKQHDSHDLKRSLGTSGFECLAQTAPRQRLGKEPASFMAHNREEERSTWHEIAPVV